MADIGSGTGVCGSRKLATCIDVCICTYRRPRHLARLLDALALQETAGYFGFKIVVVDNDPERSAERVVVEYGGRGDIAVSYLSEPITNIALARNRAVGAARGDYLAFIDDDEFPTETWLLKMFEACEMYNVEGVLGPVLPHFESEAPAWVIGAGFYDRPRHKTGFEMSWQESRTGNVLIRRRIIDGLNEVFQSEFGTGGEDQDFFRRMINGGSRFIWCDEAPVYETVPPHRWRLRFLLERALLRGRISLKHPRHRLRKVAKSLVALPVYGVALPFLLFGGYHLFAKYLVKMFDHAGRLLALVSLNPIVERNH